MSDLYAIFSPPSAEHPDGVIESVVPGEDGDAAWRSLIPSRRHQKGESFRTIVYTLKWVGYTCRPVRVYEPGKSVCVDRDVSDEKITELLGQIGYAAYCVDSQYSLPPKHRLGTCVQEVRNWLETLEK